MRIDLSLFSASLFDMDGVVTDTVDAHRAAWKRLFDEYLREWSSRHGRPFDPFDADRDYHQFIDGKPRYDGVESFLSSRGISLPRGEKEDPAGTETIYGLGNQKEGYFVEWLSKNRVRAYPGTLWFIKSLKEKGARIAVFSSSRNATAVLNSAGVLDLFDAKVDGEDLDRQHLPGKPDPAIVLEASRRLGVAPPHAVVVEDAISGVEAGVRGRFGLVIGIDRGHNREGLLKAGANLVVGDLIELKEGDAR